jgi:hypothetical protein
LFEIGLFEIGLITMVRVSFEVTMVVAMNFLNLPYALFYTAVGTWKSKVVNVPVSQHLGTCLHYY